MENQLKQINQKAGIGEAEKVEVTLPPGMSKEDFLKAIQCRTKKETKTGEPIIFSQQEAGVGKEIHVRLDYYKGKELKSVRQMYQDEAGQWQFSKGCSFEYENIDEIIAGLQKMKTWLEENPK